MKVMSLINVENMSLKVAAQEGNLAFMQSMLAEVTTKDKNDDPNIALLRAAENGHTPSVQLLLKNGARLDAKDKNDRTALFLAAANGHKRVLDLMIKDWGVKARELDSQRVLAPAAANGHMAIVRRLLEIGVNPATKDKKTKEGKSALVLAVENGHIAVAQLLLEKLNAKERSLLTVLCSTIENGHIAVLDLILKSGYAKIDLTSEMWYIEDDGAEILCALYQAAENGHLLMIWHLVNYYGLDIDKTYTVTDETALYIATARGDEAIVRLLLEKGANVDLKTDCGFTALHRASLDKNEVIVRELLDKGADPFLKDIVGETPLEKASEAGSKEIARLISEKQADIATKNKQNPRANLNENEVAVRLVLEDGTSVELNEKIRGQLLQKAADEGHKAVEEMLLDEPYFSLEDASARIDEAVLKLLSDRGVNVNSKNENEKKVVREVIDKGYEAVIKTLLEKGVDSGSGPQSLEMEEMMYHAVERGHEAITHLLLEKGADTEWKPNHYSDLPLHKASREGYEGIVRLLVEYGASIYSENFYGTALHIATIAGHLEIVQFLLEEGADINATNQHGETPLVKAIDSWNVPLIQLLIEKGADMSSAAKQASKAGHGTAMALLLNSISKGKRREGKTGVKQNDATLSLDASAFLAARMKIRPVVRDDMTYSYPLDPKRTLLNIRTGETEQCSCNTPYVIVSYVWHPENLPDNPFDDILRVRSLSQTPKASVNFEDRLKRVCEAFPQVAMKVKAEDEGIDDIALPIKTSSGLEKEYQHEVYLLAAREAHRRGVDYIWMDSLCIEQSNASAVAESINNMAENYRSAVCCVTISEVLRAKICFDPSSKDLGFEWLPGDDLLSWIVGYHPLRVWLFQETLLSKKIVSRGGNMRIEATKFFSSYQEHILGGCSMDLLCDDPEYTHFKETMTRFPTRISRNESGNPLSLNQCLELLNARMATIPQDRIFGALGLFPRDVEIAFPVDYRLSNSALYAILVYLEIFEGDLNGLLALRSYGEPRHQIGKAPSWIPTGQGRIFQDGRGKPLEVDGMTGSRVEWPQYLVLKTRWMYVADITPARATGSKFPADHNILLWLEIDGNDRLLGASQGAIEPLGYVPAEQEQENQSDKDERERYNAELSELKVAAGEKRAVVALLNRQQGNSSPSVPEVHVWVLLQTTNGGKAWRKHGLVRTDTDAVGRSNEKRKFMVI